ncbi:hypothetical protein BOS5A_200310 [Bosea sp. EC-HK365B]|nr:hypothetical protein BOSE7B_41220 [Bosea sp. 7B]VVT57864.1 hypothetical protein BOS5A_200310 [Bosea sp. EC-HK365B]
MTCAIEAGPSGADWIVETAAAGSSGIAIATASAIGERWCCKRRRQQNESRASEKAQRKPLARRRRNCRNDHGRHIKAQPNRAIGLASVVREAMNSRSHPAKSIWCGGFAAARDTSRHVQRDHRSQVASDAHA